jgi:predicted dinucleotide-binding enzyme
MTAVGVIGAGRMGSACARAVAAVTTVPVLVCSGRPAGSPRRWVPDSCVAATLSEVLGGCAPVLLAVPFAAALVLMSGPAGRGGAGRTLIDATNPGEPVGAGRSGGERIAAAAPSWHVVKAFNTVPAAQMGACLLDGEPIAVPLAGSAPAKADAADLARRLGFTPYDAGGIEGSRELESLAVLLMRLSATHDMRGCIGIRIGRPHGATAAIGSVR